MDILDKGSKKMMLPGGRKSGRPQRRFLREDLQSACATEEGARDSMTWRKMIHGGDP